MQKGKNLILQIKNIIYSKTFQKIHCVEFYTNKKTSFFDSIFYDFKVRCMVPECDGVDLV